MLLNEPTKLLLLGQLALNTFLLLALTQIMFQSSQQKRATTRGSLKLCSNVMTDSWLL